jgi:hypothetical protein
MDGMRLDRPSASDPCQRIVLAGLNPSLKCRLSGAGQRGSGGLRRVAFASNRERRSAPAGQSYGGVFLGGLANGPDQRCEYVKTGSIIGPYEKTECNGNIEMTPLHRDDTPAQSSDGTLLLLGAAGEWGR